MNTRPSPLTAPSVSALRKVTWRLIPFLFLLYVVAWLDRVNVGFAALQMNADLRFSETTFGIGSGIFFLGYCLFEVPSNLILARVGARPWISRIMITWGIISTCMMFVRTPFSFYLLRFLLGAAEAGFFPGVIYYLSRWYPARQRARAIATFMTAVPVTGLVGGPFSGALLELRGLHGLAGWQWLFLGEGLPAILLGVVAFFYLTEKPETARWLTTEERASIEEQLENAGTDHSIKDALTHPVIWKLGIIFLLVSIGFLGYSFWAPLVIKSLTNVSDLGVGWITATIGAATIVVMLLNSAHSDRTRERFVHVALALSLMTVGFVGCVLIHSSWLAVALLALVPIGHCAAYGPFWAIPVHLLSGRAAAAGTAMVVTIANVGGFVGPWLIGLLKKQTGTHTAAFLLLGGFALIASFMALQMRQTQPEM